MLISEKQALTERVGMLVKKYGNSRSALIPILQDIQHNFKYVSDFEQQEVARLLDIHPVEVYSVVSFYSFLSPNIRGKYIVRLCQTISCEFGGKDKVAKAIERELGIKFGETTKDKKFTLEYTNCMGMCDKSPAMMVNEKVYSNLTPEKAVQILKEIK